MIYFIIIIILFLFLFLIYHNRSIDDCEAIHLLKNKLYNTDIVGIINKLPIKYHRSYWENIILTNIRKTTNIYNSPFNIKKLNQELRYIPLKRKSVIKYINKTLKEIEEKGVLIKQELEKNKKRKRRA